MAYTVLNESLQVKGKLTLNNGQGSTAFFADTITQQIATDNSSDPTNSTAMAFNEYDKQGNAKQWGHSITVSVEATDLGSGISTNDYLMYFDDVNNHYYLMKVITAETDRNSGFVTISGVNTAIYELGKQIINAETTFKQANLQTVVNSLYKNAPFSVVIQDDLATIIDYTVSANTSLQAVLQDLQTKYNVDVDSWIELDESGNISDRIIYFGHIGRDNGELIRYGGAKGFENINAQELSDTIYTKLYVTGLTDDKNPTKGHIGSVNNGMEYIVDDNANGLQYAIGASQQQPVYLEGSISNTLLSEPQALLTWANAQMGIFNHPRFNYTVTPLHDQIVGIGDTIAVQDFHIKPEILVTSKVIQKSTSFASPETNTFVLGEFSSIFTENANKGAGVIQLIKKNIIVVQEAADNARVSAEAAHEQAVQAQQAAIHAQTSADGKTTTFTTNSVDDLPATANQGDIAWVTLSDGTHGYTYLNDKWVEDINPTLAKDITDGVTSAVNTAKANTDASIQANNALTNQAIDSVSKANATALINAGDFTNKAQALVNQGVSDAKANTATVASQTLATANANLAQAKSDLTTGITKEASDRATAVSALDTKAQGYANAAKTDALNALTKEVTNRQNAVSALDTKATNAVNQAKSDINDTINAISVGGRNYILNSKRTLSSQNQDALHNGSNIWWDTGWVNTSIPISDFSNKVFTISVQVDYDNVTAVKGGSRIGAEVIALRIQPDGSTVTKYFGVWHSPKVGESFHGRVSATYDMSGVALKSVYTPNHWGGGLYISSITATNVSVSNPKIEAGNKATDWTPAPEDVVLDYTTKDDQIKETITQYQTTNDGKVTKAQTDATTALGQVATKVSQTDYDTKTGDLTTKYTQVKQTTDSQATDIVDIKKTATNQASKINSISSDVDGTKQSISDIETTQDSQSDKINQITSDVNGTKQSITDIQTKDGKQDTRMGTIETSVSGVKSDFSTYKTDANGRISTAQTTAQTAVDGLKTKVSQTDYNTKTGQLQTDLTTTTQTANQAKTDIVSIKQTDTSQDSRMNTIESDASGTRQTVSQLQTVQGQQSGSISTLQQRADGFDATVTKVDNLSVGARNLIVRTGELNGQVIDIEGKLAPYVLATVTPAIITVTPGKPLTMSGTTGGDNTFRYAFYDGAGKTLLRSITDLRSATTVIAPTEAATFRISYPKEAQVKLERGNVATDWTPAPEDLSSATAKAQLTADQATLNLSNYQTSADGRITKAQADITATATQVQTKVSQSDYNAKTTDLTTKVSTAQQTADTANTTIGSYKTSNDGRVTAAETSIKANASAIALTATKQDLNSATSTLNTSIGAVNVKADSVTTTVAQLTKDTTTKFATQQTTIDGISSTVSANTGNINSVTSRVQTAEGTLSAATNNISGLTTKQTTLAGQVTQEISDRKNGDSNTLNSAANYTSSQISNSETSMKSLINQKADSVIVGTIQGDVNALKSANNWQQMSYDDMNFLKNQGNYLITGGKNLNTPINNWFYITVDAPTSSRITQHVWKDLDATLSYSRTFDGTNWTSWVQQVSSSTLLSIFKDSWSLGTSINNGITNQMIAGINGQPDGSLHLKGSSITLDGSTVVTGSFTVGQANIANGAIGNAQIGNAVIDSSKIANLDVSKLTGDTITGFNINANKQITIASGGSLQSDIVNMSKTSFGVSAPNVGVQRYSPQGYNVTVFGTFNISSVLGNISTNGSIQVTKPGDTTPYKKGDSYSTYGVNNMYIRTLNYDNKDPNEHLNIASAEIDIITGGTSGLLSDSTNATQISSSYVTTTGSVTAGSAVNTGIVYSGNGNLWLNSANASTVLQGGGTSILQARENGYMYYLTRKTGSGGSSLQVAGDGGMFVQSSATKFKEDIQYDGGTSVGDKFLTLDPATWQDKGEYDQRKAYRENGIEPDRQIGMEDERYYGLIAEDLVKAGLEEFVVRNESTGEVNGLEYDKVAISLIPVVREQRNAINELRLEIEKLKEQK